MAPRELARLIVPLDTSATAELALHWAALLARDRAMEVHLLTVWSEQAPIPGMDAAKPVAEILSELEQYLAGVASRLEREGAPVTAEARAGDVVAEIRAATEARPGSMVLVASHGQGGYQEAYLGSTTDRLIRTLDVPVLVIPARESGA